MQYDSLFNKLLRLPDETIVIQYSFALKQPPAPVNVPRIRFFGQHHHRANWSLMAGQYQKRQTGSLH
jgi:hypothetical protein